MKALAKMLLAGQWQTVGWPEGHKEPMKDRLSTLPEDMPLQRMLLEAQVALAHRARLPGSQARPWAQ